MSVSRRRRVCSLEVISTCAASEDVFSIRNGIVLAAPRLAVEIGLSQQRISGYYEGGKGLQDVAMRNRLPSLRGMEMIIEQLRMIFEQLRRMLLECQDQMAALSRQAIWLQNRLPMSQVKDLQTTLANQKHALALLQKQADALTDLLSTQFLLSAERRQTALMQARQSLLASEAKQLTDELQAVRSVLGEEARIASKDATAPIKYSAGYDKTASDPFDWSRDH